MSYPKHDPEKAAGIVLVALSAFSLTCVALALKWTHELMEGH